MRTQRLIAYAFAACLVSLTAGTAMADDGSGNFNAFLQGKYRVSAYLNCAAGPEIVSIGSNPTSYITFAGVINYDGHGHATLTDQGLIIGTGSPDRFDEACEFRYEVARDGSFSQTGSCTGAGGSYKLSGIKYTGQIGVGGAVLSLSSAELVVQKLEAPAVSPTFTLYRICGAVETGVRIHP
jgi:hypothetical protein